MSRGALRRRGMRCCSPGEPDAQAGHCRVLQRHHGLARLAARRLTRRVRLHVPAAMTRVQPPGDDMIWFAGASGHSGGGRSERPWRCIVPGLCIVRRHVTLPPQRLWCCWCLRACAQAQTARTGRTAAPCGRTTCRSRPSATSSVRPTRPASPPLGPQLLPAPRARWLRCGRQRVALPPCVGPGRGAWTVGGAGRRPAALLQRDGPGVQGVHLGALCAGPKQVRRMEFRLGGGLGAAALPPDACGGGVPCHGVWLWEASGLGVPLCG